MNPNNLFKIQKAINLLLSIDCDCLERTEQHTAQYTIDECVNNLNSLYRANINKKEHV